MVWASLGLWADEEERIHHCLVEALQQLIASQTVVEQDNELVVSGKLRPHLYRAKKKQKLVWTIQIEAASFPDEEAPKPYGHPDIRFSQNTPDFEQYDYDVECKLVRIKRTGKSHNYCEYYVTNGVQRFNESIYAQSAPPMGTMIGYLQAGNASQILKLINDACRKNSFSEIVLQNEFLSKDVTHSVQSIERPAAERWTLTHLWADVR